MPEQRYVSESGKYVIQHTTSWSGDSAIWWRPDHNGYTYNLDEAGRYDEAEARLIEKNRACDLAVPIELATKAATLHVPGPILDRVLSAEAARMLAEAKSRSKAGGSNG